MLHSSHLLLISEI